MSSEHTQIHHTNFFDKAIMVDLTRAVTDIASSLEQSALIETTAMHLMRLLKADGCLAIGLHPETQESLVCKAFHSSADEQKIGIDPAGLIDSPRLKLVLNENRILQINVSDSALSPEERKWINTAHIQSLLMLPLCAADRYQGAMVVLHSQTPRFYDKQDVLIGHLIASQASTAMFNAFLYQDSRQRTGELEAVRKAALSVTASLDLQQVLNAILKSTMELLSDVQHAHIFLYQNDRLVFGVARWNESHAEHALAEPRPEGLSYTVARTGAELLVEDMNAHPLFSDGNFEWRGAIIGLPLKIGEIVVGVMNVAYQNPRKFQTSELRILKLLGDHAAIAIEKARLHQLIDRQAHTDILTGLPNRRAFLERLEQEVLRARRYHHPFVLAMIDLNQFKPVNDNFGHPVGDLVLQQTASFLQNSVRDTDFIARFGGDEFVFIFPETNLISAQRIMQKILDNYERFPIHIQAEKIISLTAAAGLSVFPDMASDGESLIRLADQEMYQLKRQLGLH